MSIHDPLEAACANGPHAGALVFGRSLSISADGAKVSELFALVRSHAERTSLPLVLVVNALTNEEGPARVRGVLGLLVRSVTEPMGPLSLAGVDLAARELPPEVLTAVQAEGVTLGAEGLFVAPCGWSLAGVHRAGQRKPFVACAAEDDPEPMTAEQLAALTAGPATFELRAGPC